MKISATSFRILKFLNANKAESFRDHTLIHKLKLDNRQKLDEAIYELQKMNLAGGGKGNISYKPEGEKYYNNIININDELIVEDVQNNYDFAVLKFLYYNDWGVKENEFPTLIIHFKKKEIIQDYFEQMRLLIDCDKYSDYRLTPQGKAQFALLNKLQENKKSQLDKPTTINNFTGNQIGNVHTGNLAGDLNQTSLREDLAKTHPTKEPIAPQTNIIKKIWGSVMNNPMSAAILGGIIAMIAGTLILKHYHVI